MIQYSFEAIGTTWIIDIYKDLSSSEKDRVLGLIKNRIDLFDIAYSRFRNDSLVTKMSKESGEFIVPDDAKAMMDVYRDLYERTGGLVTPLIGNIISDAGYDAQYSLKQKKTLEKAPAWDDVMEYHHPQLKIKKPIILDFGAAGKGYLVDLVGDVLEAEGITEYCIDAGGDILHKNKEVLRVGLENPLDKEQAVGVYNLKNESICGSAGNPRVWADFTHIINPKTLTSPKEILAVWVIAEKALIADALATCLFFVDAKSLADVYRFKYLIVRDDFSIEKSKDFQGEVFT